MLNDDQKRALSIVDAVTDNAMLPTYSELVAALRKVAEGNLNYHAASAYAQDALGRLAI